MGYDVYAGVFEGNAPSRALFTKLGFKVIGNFDWDILIHIKSEKIKLKVKVNRNLLKTFSFLAINNKNRFKKNQFYFFDFCFHDLQLKCFKGQN